MIGLPWWMDDSWTVAPRWFYEPTWTTANLGTDTGTKNFKAKETAVTEQEDKAAQHDNAGDNFDVLFDAMDKFYKSCGMTGEMTFTQNGKTRSVKLGTDKSTGDDNNYRPDDTPEAKRALAKIRDDLAALIQDRNLISDSIDEYNDNVQRFNKELGDYTNTYGKTEYTEQKSISLKQ